MEPAFIPVNIAVLTVSDTRTIETDGSGQYIVDLRGCGCHGCLLHDATVRRTASQDSDVAMTTSNALRLYGEILEIAVRWLHGTRLHPGEYRSAHRLGHADDRDRRLGPVHRRSSWVRLPWVPPS